MATLKIQKADGTYELLQLTGADIIKLKNDVLNNTDKISILSNNLENHESDYITHTGFAITEGSSNNYIATLEPALSTYAEGVSLRIKIHEENTDVATINVNELGEVSIKKADGSDLDPNQLKQDGIYTIVYNGANFILQGEGGGSALKEEERSSLITSINGILSS